MNLKSAAHAKPLPSTIEEAISIIPGNLSPTVTVATGNGLHAWWLFKEPWIFSSSEERKKAMALSFRWQTLLKYNSAENGWRFDRLADLARVPRIPGTVNAKDPNNLKCVTMQSYSGHRYNPSDFERYLANVSIPDPDQEERGSQQLAEQFANTSFMINLNAAIPEQTLAGWMAGDQRFRHTWNRQRPDLADQSGSGYDMALASFGVRAGLIDQQIVDLIIHHRRIHGEQQRRRIDYFQRTISKARKTEVATNTLTLPGGLAAVLSASDGNPGAGSDTGVGDPAVKRAMLCDRISQLFGVCVMRIMRLAGSDPIYLMHLPEGPIEFDIKRLMSYRAVKLALAAQAGRLIPALKGKQWEEAAQMILDACTPVEATDDLELEGYARIQITKYLAEVPLIAAVLEASKEDKLKPVIDEGRIAISSIDIQTYLNRVTSQGVSVKAVAAMCAAVGAVAIRHRPHARIDQSRWALPVDKFDPKDYAHIWRTVPMVNEVTTGTVDGIGQLDHSRSSEYWIVGPPGTGKTTSISRQVQRAAREFGSSSVLVTSFSRAAAAELAACDLPIPPEQLGTLHSHCFQALGKPQIAEVHVGEWNRSKPHLALTPVRGHVRLDGEDSVEEDPGCAAHAGDLLLRELNRYRGLMVDPDLWPTRIREFERKWVRYKRDRHLLDFTDLIEIGLRDFVSAPGNPSVIFVDEAQDLNVMQLRLVRKWGERAYYSILAFDDDQTIHSFMGARPEAILDAVIPDDHKVVLRQSHRVPRAVHQFADVLIRRVSRRQEKIHHARPAPGEVHRLSGTYKAPEYALLSSLMKHLERGQTIMLLASCSYMLQPLIQVLRKHAVPFQNPYRRYNGLWNPLRVGPNSTMRRLLALLLAHPQYGERQRQWTHGDVRLWAEYLPNGVLRAGARELLVTADARESVTMGRLAEILEPTSFCSLLCALERNWRALLEWWRTRVAAEYRNRIHFPACVVEQCGTAALVEQPKVVIGTIHSVKGGEADVVYLFPDLSRAADEHYQIAGAARDSVIRVFYVGATRARETLYICQPVDAAAMRF